MSPNKANAEGIVKSQKGLINILLIGSNTGDYSSLSKLLSQAKNKNKEFKLEYAKNLSEAFQRVDRGNIHLILLDLPIPRLSNLGAFSKLYEHCPTIPIVILTAIDDDALALEVVSKGAQDYLVKSKIHGAVILRVIRYAIERKREELILKEKLQKAMDLTQESQLTTERKSKFLAYVNHEIRVPMNAVLGMSQLLLKTSLNDKQKHYLDTIISSGNLILKIINDVLDLSKI